MPVVLRPSGEKGIGSLSGRFRGAQGRLTLIYTALLACILLVSSSVTYSAFSSRLERRFARFPPRPPVGIPQEMIPPRAEEVRADLINTLLIVNGFLLAVAGVLSYWLAGMTLAPIQAAYERQRRFLSDASHELRTPLAILQTDLENARAETASSALQAQFTSHLEEVERMSQLVRDLLRLSRLDEETTPRQAEKETDIQTAIEMTIVRLTRLAETHEVTLSTVFPKTKTRSWLVNEERFLQAFENLTKNAILYNRPNGTVSVELGRDGQTAVITIKDTGIGIAAEALEHIFERFYRVDVSRSRQTGGSGLGLAITRAAMERLQGTIKLDSAVDVGTTVTLLIPFAEAS